MTRKKEEIDSVNSSNGQESQKYETMFLRLEGIVEELSGKDTMDLDKVVSSIEEGYKLIEAMKERLSQAKDKVEMIKKLNISTENQEDKETDDSTPF